MDKLTASMQAVQQLISCSIIVSTLHLKNLTLGLASIPIATHDMIC